MKTIRLALIISAAMLAGLQARADTLSNLTIQGVVAAEGGIFIQFSPAPAACSGGTYLTGHGFVPRSVARFEEFYGFAMQAKLLGKLVAITYTDRGNCQQPGTTLLITDLR